MGISAKYLGEGEEVIVDAKPFVGVLFSPVFTLLVVAAAVLVVVALIPKSTPLYVGIILGIPVLISMFWAIAKWIKWTSYSFVVTNRRVVERTGVFGKSMREIPIRRIQSLSIKQSFFERILKAGTLIVDSAGSGNDGRAEFKEIGKVQEVFHLLSSLLDENENNSGNQESGL
ncbi:MAG: PH domain-containing protein [Acidimicrobiales bacterium]|nr:PH domain-containing protein [Acidimicrobiales bacterium]